jgi:hypothetical protein
MNTEDLEHNVVRALHELYPEPLDSTLTVPRTQPWRPVRAAAIVGAIVALAAVGVTAGLLETASSGPGPTPGRTATNSPFYVGYTWRLTSIMTPGRTTAIPDTIRADVAFPPSGLLVLRGAINTVSGRYQITQSGFVPHNLATTLAPTSGADALEKLIEDAFAMDVWEGSEVRAVISTDNTLILSVGVYSMSFERLATTPSIAPTPAATTRS